VITAGALHGAADWTPFEGLRARGFAAATILRGKIIVQDGRLLAAKGTGRYLHRHPWGDAIPRV
jgi:dihydropyrimidinase